MKPTQLMSEDRCPRNGECMSSSAREEGEEEHVFEQPVDKIAPACMAEMLEESIAENSAKPSVEMQVECAAAEHNGTRTSDWSHGVTLEGRTAHQEPTPVDVMMPSIHNGNTRNSAHDKSKSVEPATPNCPKFLHETTDPYKAACVVLCCVDTVHEPEDGYAQHDETEDFSFPDSDVFAAETGDDDPVERHRDAGEELKKHEDKAACPKRCVSCWQKTLLYIPTAGRYATIRRAEDTQPVGPVRSRDKVESAKDDMRTTSMVKANRKPLCVHNCKGLASIHTLYEEREFFVELAVMPHREVEMVKSCPGKNKRPRTMDPEKPKDLRPRIPPPKKERESLRNINVPPLITMILPLTLQ